MDVLVFTPIGPKTATWALGNGFLKGVVEFGAFPDQIILQVWSKWPLKDMISTEA